MGSAAENIEGRLAIRLGATDGAVQQVEIRSSRPLQTPRIFLGKSVHQLLSTLPLLYSVCGTAQACAAVTACERALGQRQSPSAGGARQRLVWLETAKEHLWRVLLDWPSLLGRPQQPEGVAEMMQLIKRYRDACYPGDRPFLPGSQPAEGVDNSGVAAQLAQLLERWVFAMPPARWSELESAQALLAWAETEQTPAAIMLDYLRRQDWGRLGSSDIGGLPGLSAGWLQGQLNDQGADGFVALPQIDGVCHETSPLTRVAQTPLLSSLLEKQGNGLLTRYSARLLELASLPQQLLWQPAPGAGQESCDGLPQGTGIAQVEAARGRLVHRVVLADDRVGGYQIVAPTEWNFHPQGALARGLQGLSAASGAQLRQQAVLLINAIDPCVGYELQIDHG